MATTTLSFLNTNSGAIQAISTIILVAVTIYYSYQTRQTVKETANTRKDTRLPIIRVGMRGPIGGGYDTQSRPQKHIRLFFENIGYGLALNIKFSFANKEFITIENLNIGEKTDFQLKLEFNEEEIINNLLEHEKKILTVYTDIFGRTINTLSYFKHNHRGDWIEFDISSWHPNIPK